MFEALILQTFSFILVFVVELEPLISDLNLGDTFLHQVIMDRVHLVSHSPVLHHSLDRSSDLSIFILLVVESSVNSKL